MSGKKTIDVAEDVEKLIKKAAKEETNPDAALKFTQAACNAANAMSVLSRLEHDLKQ